MFWKMLCTFFLPRTHELHLGLDRNIPPPSCAPSPHCFMTSHPVASCPITVQRGPGVEWHQTVSQHLWWDLQLQGWGGGWGGNPWVWRKWSNLKRSSCIRELPIFLHFYTTTTISSVSWARGTVCQYILQFWDIFWYRSDVEEFLSWKWWLWWVLVQTLQSGLHHLGQSSYLHKHLSQLRFQLNTPVVQFVNCFF